MNIKATVYVNEGDSKIKASANITIEECFVVKGIRIIEGSNGLFTAMPSKKGVNGDYKDICFPITAEARQIINDEILRAYYEKLGNNAPAETPVTNNNFDFSSDDLPF